MSDPIHESVDVPDVGKGIGRRIDRGQPSSHRYVCRKRWS
jgi:hypothetical protein